MILTLFSSLKRPAFAGLFFVIACASSCTSRLEKISTKPVVVVNEHQLGAKEFAEMLGRRLKDQDPLMAKDPAVVKSAKDEIIKTFIVQSLTLDWARQQKITVTDEELDKAVDTYRANYPDDLSFRHALAQENISFSEWREQLRYNLIERAVFQKRGEKMKVPSEDEIKKAFDENRDHFKKRERISFRQIVVDDANKAELLVTELKTHDFADLAKKYSITPEGKTGGSVGWIEKGTVDFFDPLFSRSLNSIGPIIHSPYGYHVVRVEKKLPASNGSLDEARPLLIRNLQAQKDQAEFVSWLDVQIRSSKIMKDWDLINSMTVDTKKSDN